MGAPLPIAALRAIIAALITLSVIAVPITMNIIKVYMWALGVRGHARDVNYYNAFRRRSNGIVVFNHPTPFDQWVMCKELGLNFRLVAKKEHLPGPILGVARRFNCLIIEKGVSTAERIREEVAARRPGDPHIALAPAAGHTSADITELGEFRTGAFLPLTPVCPVVIHYSPYKQWPKGVHVGAYLWRMIRASPVYYQLRVLPPMAPRPQETAREFADRVREAMAAALREMHTVTPPPPPKPRINHAITSLSFFVAAGLALARGALVPAVGMLIVATTSVIYHGFGGIHARFIDVISNFTLGVFFAIRAIRRENYAPVVFGLIAILGYIFKPCDHALCVHLPTFLGFLRTT